jgi:hypothetical protein
MHKAMAIREHGIHPVGKISILTGEGSLVVLSNVSFVEKSLQ